MEASEKPRNKYALLNKYSIYPEVLSYLRGTGSLLTQISRPGPCDVGMWYFKVPLTTGHQESGWPRPNTNTLAMAFPPAQT